MVPATASVPPPTRVSKYSSPEGVLMKAMLLSEGGPSAAEAAKEAEAKAVGRRRPKAARASRLRGDE